MKRMKLISSRGLLLLLVLFLTATQPVMAERSNQKGRTPFFVGLMTPDVPKTLCTGQKINLEFYFIWIGPPPLVGKNEAVVNISAQRGKATPGRHIYLLVHTNSTYTGKFSYAAGKAEGDETIKVEVSLWDKKTTLPIPLKIKKCRGSLQFNITTTLSYQMVSMTNDYFGSGALSTDNNGRITGSGTQAIWSDILPYSAEGASCQHTPPWEGSSGIAFSGQMGDDGDTQVTMDLEALSINASALTCTGEDSSGSTSFPGYTYSSCQVQLAGFNFEAGTLDVPFNCPGESPYTVPITIIPRRDS